ncbi:MAG: peptidoglycan-binding domain-containing protein [Pseudomonadota bacterium]
MQRLLTALAILLALALPVRAEDVALIVSNGSYDNHPDPVRAKGAGELRTALADAGFRVIRVQGVRRDEISRVRSVVSTLRQADRMVIYLTGHVVSTGRGSWLLAKDAGRPDEFNIGRNGLPIEPLLDLAGERPGRAIVLVSPERRSIRVSGQLEPDFLARDIPQGVMVLTGPAVQLNSVMANGILVPGQSIGSSLETAGDSVVASGFVPENLVFQSVPRTSASDASDSERRFWQLMSRLNTPEGYQNYLTRYPEGAFVDEARRRLSVVSVSPEALAKAEEDGLGLSRDARREIQRNLTLIGYGTRGIDGIFGRGTRAAIRDWQAATGLEATGYLTGNQIVRLEEAAAVRSRELEEEARRRQEEVDRRDTAYWRDLGRGQDEAALRAYLERYPDGLYADIAEGRLAAIEAERAAAAEVEERAFWEDVTATDTVGAYEAYLERYPEGAFADEARAKIGEAETSPDDARIAAARAEEARTLANPITRLLVERRLGQLGLNPGQADGKFDEQTRRAVRRFQRAREIPVTGYVDQTTLVQLLASN